MAKGGSRARLKAYLLGSFLALVFDTTSRRWQMVDQRSQIRTRSETTIEKRKPGRRIRSTERPREETLERAQGCRSQFTQSKSHPDPDSVAKSSNLSLCPMPDPAGFDVSVDLEDARLESQRPRRDAPLFRAPLVHACLLNSTMARHGVMACWSMGAGPCAPRHFFLLPFLLSTLINALIHRDAPHPTGNLSTQTKSGRPPSV